jgi:predicted GTPase
MLKEKFSVIKRLSKEINDTLTNAPPTIGVIGVSGVGKSSTINKMFKTNLRTSDTVRCTTEFSDQLLGTTISSGPKKGQKAILRVVDAPGLGEDFRTDTQHLQMYRENLPRCDVILWVMTARNRAVALDQMYLEKLSEFSDRIFFGINQVDIVEPIDWDENHNLPSKTQAANIKAIEVDRSERISIVLKRKPTIVSYSAKLHFNLIRLFEEAINTCPPERRWLFDLIKNTSPKDWLAQAKGISEEEKRRIIAKYGE